MNLLSLFKNKVVFYLASRYVTYGVQFITSLVIASELGPYYMGIWGFILLLLQYFQQFHLGIANSFNVLYVHHRDNEKECNNYIGNSLVLVSCLATIVVLFYIYYCASGISGFGKYNVDKYIIWICLIAILQYFVQFFINLFRVKNQLNRVTFCQSVIVFLNFICIFFFKEEELVGWLVAGYLVGNIICVLIAVTSGSIPAIVKIQIRKSLQIEILKKGLFLFLFNSCFYFIIISIRTIISGKYRVEEFGSFTFSFSLANAVLLLLEALSFIIFPKVIGKLSSNDENEVIRVLRTLRMLYITSAHLLIYGVLIIFPFLLALFPKYHDALTALNLIALTILVNSNSYGYSELLISRNKEKISALISFVSLVINCILGILFAYVFNCQYSYVILATMLTYVFYSYVTMFFAQRMLHQSMTLENYFPLRLMTPYISALIISLFHLNMYIWVPFVIALILNIRQIQKIFNLSKELIINPERVNL